MTSRAYSLDIYKDEKFCNDKLTCGLDHHGGFSNGIRVVYRNGPSGNRAAVPSCVHIAGEPAARWAAWPSEHRVGRRCTACWMRR
jgi:hypothetical protein